MATTTLDDAPPEPRLPSLVVGVGSSAGGLEALTELVLALDADLDCALVVAQHRRPGHDHHDDLAALLARVALVEVREAVDGDRLRPGVVLVGPPGCDVVVVGAAIELRDPVRSQVSTPSIDLLLQSLATSWSDRAVAVVLSGTGDDGTVGAGTVRGSGGLVLAQDPGTAAFDDMPDAVVASGVVSAVLAPREIAAAISRSVAALGRDHSLAPGDAEREISDVLAAVGRETGTDYTAYKTSTVLRQVARRQALTGTDDLGDYRRLVVTEASEARALASAMSITVTWFFRDPQVWLQVQGALADLVAGLDEDQQLRIWVPGCATGQEAYTAAMVAAEVLGPDADLRRRLKVFATDLDEPSLAVARRAHFTDTQVESLPDAMRDRWMRRGADGWDVSPLLRDCIVVARHDVTNDPPFPHVHAVCLRNTLIYFRSELQERVVRFCHFSLVDGGLLVLGESERVDHPRERFEPVAPGSRVYRRLAGGAAESVPSPRSTPRPAATTSGRPPVVLDAHAVLQQALVTELLPPSLVVDEHDDVVEVVGDVSPWCWVAEGRHSAQAVALLRSPLRVPVRGMLMQLRYGDGDRLEQVVEAESGPVLVRVARIRSDPGGHAVLSFVVADADGSEPSGPPPSPDEVARLADELESTRAALQGTIEELASSNEDLQALNEELQASSEELQASTEEVQATNEELEAANEQLAALNDDLHAQGEDLADTNQDLLNIQHSLAGGLVLLDAGLRVTSFTPAAVRLFSLIEADRGRPLTEVPTSATVPQLERRLRAAVDDQVSDVVEVRGDELEFLVQVQPYVSGSGEVRGAVVVVTDITDLAESRRASADVLADLRRVAATIDVAVWQRDGSGRFTFVNEGVETVYGLSRRQVLDDPDALAAAVHPDDRRLYATATSGSRGRWRVEHRVVHPDGDVRWVDERVTTVDGPDGPLLVGSVVDVTRSRTASERLLARDAVLEALLGTEVFGALVLDADERIVEANQTFASLLGYDRDELVGAPMSLLGEPADAAVVGEPAVTATQLRLVDREGVVHQVTAVRTPVASTDGRAAGSVVMIHDETRVQALGRDLERSGRYDDHTGLMTRGYFRKRLAEALEDGGAAALLWIDLDGFKEINDRYGHRAGDEVLGAVANRLQSVARRDDLVARLGGDEFAVMVSGTSRQDQVENVAERVLEAVRMPITLADSVVFVSASVGVAVSPEDGVVPDDLMHNADTAMYSAKADGHDRHAYFRREMNAVAEGRAALRQHLAAAVRDHSFVMHYQPIVDLTTGSTGAVEALLRWNRDGRAVAAEDFISLAEDTGQLRVLGRIAMELVTEDMRHLDDAQGTHGLRTALNLSASELGERDFVDRLLRWDVPGGFERLVVEVTESVALEKGSRAYDTLLLLRRLGATLSIDDFGTGYSSLSILDSLQPALIKIDRTLVERTRTGPRSRDLLTATVQMVHALGARAVMEGVESSYEEGLARELGVDLVQGYGVAQPMPVAELAAWVVEHPRSAAE